MQALALPYPEHLSSTAGTYTLSRRLTIFHGNAFGILHLFFGTAFYTICLHRLTSLFDYEQYTIPLRMSRVLPELFSARVTQAS